MLALAVGVMCLPLGFVAMPWTVRTVAAAPDWPVPPAGVADSEPAKIRYQAEVSETAKRREKAMATETDPPAALLALAIAGLAIVFAGGSISRRSTGDEAAPAKPASQGRSISER